jgi:hypothetical protein
LWTSEKAKKKLPGAFAKKNYLNPAIPPNLEKEPLEKTKDIFAGNEAQQITGSR